MIQIAPSILLVAGSAIFKQESHRQAITHMKGIASKYNKQ